MFNTIINFITNHTPLFYLTQSIWRDEGFSYFMAKPNILEILKNSINDFNPPLYYIFLHFWLKIFGETDIALRMLSFVFHLLTVYFAYLLARKIFTAKFAWWVAAFTMLNPLLIYYGFELRMYSMYAFFTLASLYYFLEKRWRAYIIVTTLGIYTHSFFLLVILSQMAYLYIGKQLSKKNLKHLIKPILFFLPWVPFILWQFKESQNTWIFRVDMQLVTSSLGNLFTGYEGTPGGLWGKTALLSLVILIFLVWGGLRNKKVGLLFGIVTLVPLAFILLYSLIRRPVYVNRYMIFVTIGEIFAISLGVFSIRRKLYRYFFMSCWFLLVLCINYFAVGFHKKVDIRSTIMEISQLAKRQDVIYAQTPLVYFESAFYYPNKNNVFIYNPGNIVIPKYIGTAVIPIEKSKLDFPEEPIRTFLVRNDGSYEVVMKRSSLK